jgi:type VI secretion system protein ImpK
MVSESNELVKFATSLMIFMTQARHTTSHSNVSALRAHIIEEIHSFEKKLSEINYPLQMTIAARYCLCTAIDESVLSQPWGAQSIWVQNSLLNIFQNETMGGKRFYVILEDSLRNIPSNIDFIELIYYLLSLGFEGQYFGEEHRTVREEIRNRLFYHIRHTRIKPERTLSLCWKSHESSEQYQKKNFIVKRSALFSLGVVMIFAVFYNVKVYRAAEPIVTELNNLAVISPITTFSDVISRSIVARQDEERI